MSANLRLRSPIRIGAVLALTKALSVHAYVLKGFILVVSTVRTVCTGRPCSLNFPKNYWYYQMYIHTSI